jgi:hypothetical protein
LYFNVVYTLNKITLIKSNNHAARLFIQW